MSGAVAPATEPFFCTFQTAFNFIQATFCLKKRSSRSTAAVIVDAIFNKRTHQICCGGSFKNGSLFSSTLFGLTGWYCKYECHKDQTIKIPFHIKLILRCLLALICLDRHVLLCKLPHASFSKFQFCPFSKLAVFFAIEGFEF